MDKETGIIIPAKTVGKLRKQMTDKQIKKVLEELTELELLINKTFNNIFNKIYEKKT